jgi:hypothetical protein
MPRDVGASPRVDGYCSDDGAASCGHNGRCDGAGACQLYLTGTSCRAPGCDNAWTLRPTAVCDGVGHCLQPASLTCTPYTCASGHCAVDDNCPGPCAPFACDDLAGRCKTFCASDGDCTPPFTCLNGSCVTPDGGP